MFAHKSWAVLLALSALVLAGAMPIYENASFSIWHDSQRSIQAIIFVITSVGILTLRQARFAPLFLNARITLLIVGVIAWGLVSVLVARHTLWALTEWSLMVGMLGMAWFSFLLRQRLGRTFDFLVLVATLLVSFVVLVRFLGIYVAVLDARLPIVNLYGFFFGFSNPRFFGQFASLVLPLLGLALIDTRFKPHHRTLAVLLLLLCWTWVFTSGTRGTLLAFGLVVGLFWVMGGHLRKWALGQIVIAIFALMLMWVLFYLVPSQLGIEIFNDPAERVTLALSGREELWLRAFKMMANQPILGVGPMHYADFGPGCCSHPHQSILQWGAEWGLPSLGVVMLIAGYAILKLLAILGVNCEASNSENYLRGCLAGSILAGLIQSMVDGVFVMPIPQTWFALLLGWLIALCVAPGEHPAALSSKPDVVSTVQRPPLANIFITLSVIVASFTVSYKVYVDKDTLEQRHESYLKETGSDSYHPRFWSDGHIVWD